MHLKGQVCALVVLNVERVHGREHELRGCHAALQRLDDDHHLGLDRAGRLVSGEINLGVGDVDGILRFSLG